MNELEKKEVNSSQQTVQVEPLTFWADQKNVLKIVMASAIVFAFITAIMFLVIGFLIYSNHRLMEEVKLLSRPLPPLSSQPADQEITVSVNAPVLGNPEAKVTLVEYADFQCPYCQKFFQRITPQLKKDYIDTGKAKFIFQDFAFLGEESLTAAEAAKCAGDQGKFWQFHDLLYQTQQAENSGAFNAANMKKIAVSLGVQSKQFNTCLDTHAHQKDVQAEYQAGINYGVSATPTLFINGKKIEGVPDYNDLKQIIDQQLAKE